jgi:hypothetical protein
LLDFLSLALQYSCDTKVGIDMHNEQPCVHVVKNMRYISLALANGMITSYKRLSINWIFLIFNVVFVLWLEVETWFKCEWGSSSFVTHDNNPQLMTKKTQHIHNIWRQLGSTSHTDQFLINGGNHPLRSSCSWQCVEH